MRMGLGTSVAASGARLKWALNEEKRIAILENELEVIRIHRVDRDTFLCYQEKNMPCPYCKQEEYRYWFAMNVLVYNPDRKSCEIKIWRFGQSTYEDLKRLKDKWHDLTAMDLSVTCTQEQFQTVTVQP